jgi:hypothetical protein
VTDLSGVEAKIGRAKRQIADLTRAIEAAVEDAPKTFTLEFDSISGQHVLRIHGLPLVDPEWALLVGEILYNLRSALDHLAWQAVLFDERQPCKDTHFPVRESRFNRKGQPVPTQLTPPVSNPDLLRALEDVQPYMRPDGKAQDFRLGHLFWLNKLCNIDKHRLLLVVATAFDYGRMWWAGQLAQHVEVSGKPLEEGDPVAWFDFGGYAPAENFDPHPGLHIVMWEPEVLQIAHLAIAQVLDTLRWLVEEYILDWRFRPIFNGESPLFPLTPQH